MSVCFCVLYGWLCLCDCLYMSKYLYLHVCVSVVCACCVCVSAPVCIHMHVIGLYVEVKGQSCVSVLTCLIWDFLPLSLSLSSVFNQSSWLSSFWGFSYICLNIRLKLPMLCAQVSYGFWGFELRSSHLYSKLFYSQNYFPSPAFDSVWNEQMISNCWHIYVLQQLPRSHLWNRNGLNILNSDSLLLPLLCPLSPLFSFLLLCAWML